MGMLKKMAENWKAMTLAQKIDLVIDVVSGAGCALCGIVAGNKLSKGHNIVEKICIKTATTGLGLAAADVSAKALKENYGHPLAEAVEGAKARIEANKAKEAVANE